MNAKCYGWFALLLFLAACGQAHEEAPAAPPEAAAPAADIETTSLRGAPLGRPDFDGALGARLDSNLAVAQARYTANPQDADAAIWLGRRLGYLWRYNDAVAQFTQGLEQHPDDARLYRHRGHRYLSLRDFARAEADLAHAATLIEGTEDQVEPDGQPNARGIPTSTLHTNIYYHLGLAHYLQGDFAAAQDAFERCLEASGNPDMYVATADWLYMTLRRLGQDDQAAALLATITPDMDIIENHAYHRRLLMYQGAIAPEELLAVPNADDADLTFATQGYGVGNWHLYNGRPDAAKDIFTRVLESGYWPAFGYIAAEADLVRMTD